jgi:tRNA pseudouridine55 synthase
MSELDGFLVVNKPGGLTSHDVVAFARRHLHTRRIGHTGTLDPLATGVLVLGIGQGTKLIEDLVGCEKEYEAELTFGCTSNTYDAEGEILQNESAEPFEVAELEQLLPKFTGEIQQRPPVFSAIKVNGKAAYHRARAGEEFELPARRVQIFRLELTKFAWPKACLRVHCGSGTYIRSLAHDLGQKLGTGALLSRLTRTRVGNFLLNQAVPLRSIRPDKILPLAAGVTLARINLTAVEAKKLKTGQKIPCPGRAGTECEPRVAGFFDDKIIAILEFESAKKTLKPVKVFN